MELATSHREVWYSSLVTASPYVRHIFPYSFLGKLMHQGRFHPLSCAYLALLSNGTKSALFLDQHRVKILLFKSFFGFSIIVFLALICTIPALKLKMEKFQPGSCHLAVQHSEFKPLEAGVNLKSSFPISWACGLISRSLLLGKQLSLCSSVHALQSKGVSFALDSILSKGVRSLSKPIGLFPCRNLDLNQVSFTRA